MFDRKEQVKLLSLRLQVGRHGDGGVVYQDIDVAEMVDGTLHHVHDLLFDSEVHLEGEGCAPRLRTVRAGVLDRSRQPTGFSRVGVDRAAMATSAPPSLMARHKAAPTPRLAPVTNGDRASK